MRPSQIGFLLTMLFVPLGAVIYERYFRKPKPVGTVQRYPMFVRVLLVVMAAAFLAGTVAWAFRGPREVPARQYWFSFGLFSFVAVLFVGIAYYYIRYQVIVSPTTLTIRRPFRGTVDITRDDVISSQSYRFKGTLKFQVVYRDGDKRQRVEIDATRLDLDAFTCKTFPQLRAYIKSHVADAERFLVCEGVNDPHWDRKGEPLPDGTWVLVEMFRMHYLYLMGNGKKHTLRLFRKEEDAVVFFLRLIHEGWRQLELDKPNTLWSEF